MCGISALLYRPHTGAFFFNKFIWADSNKGTRVSQNHTENTIEPMR